MHTSNHERALEILDEHKVLVISGEPGIGKTTLADQLCLHFVRNEYELVHIAESIEEAENVFDSTQKQIIYFDDFLGRNYLEALSGHEGSRIVPFIRRIRKSKDKRLILTSRSTILNRGRMLIDELDQANIKSHEYLLQISSLTEIDRAWIVYNHICFSDLEQSFIEEIYRNKRYRDIVGHQNFNPRLIKFITDQERLSDIKDSQYWNYIIESLDNPSEVWEHPFFAQQDDYGRAAVLLVTLNRRPIDEGLLGVAFQRYVVLSVTLKGSNDYTGTIRQLTGSLLSRHISSKALPIIDLFNPSIGDFVLRRYARDVTALSNAIFSLRSFYSLQALEALAESQILTEQDYLAVLSRCISHVRAEGFGKFNSLFLSVLTWQLAQRCQTVVATPDDIVQSILAIQHMQLPDDVTWVAKLYGWSFDKTLLNANIVLEFIQEATDNSRNEDELQLLAALVEKIEMAVPSVDAVRRPLATSILETISENLSRIVSDGDAFVDVDYGDYYTAERRVAQTITEKLSSYPGMRFETSDIQEVVDNFDVEDELNDFYQSQREGDGDRRIFSVPVKSEIQGVDDIFDRG